MIILVGIHGKTKFFPNQRRRFHWLLSYSHCTAIMHFLPYSNCCVSNIIFQHPVALMYPFTHSLPSLMQLCSVSSQFRVTLKSQSTATCFSLTFPSSGNCSLFETATLHYFLSQNISMLLHFCPSQYNTFVWEHNSLSFLIEFSSCSVRVFCNV
jgi:hypothetical protein